MATTDSKTRVNTLITISYSIPVSDDHLMRQEVHRVKDETTTDFVITLDTTADVGEKDDWRDQLQDQLDFTETQKADSIDAFDDQIELLQEQIDEIDSL